MASLHEQARRLVVATLTERTGQRVMVGRLSGDLWGNLRLDHVVLRGPGRATTLLEAGSVILDYDLRAILRDRSLPLRHVSSVHLVSPTLLLERLPDGRWNLQQLLPPRLPPGRSSFVGVLRITNGRLRLRDHLNPQPDGSPWETTLEGVRAIADFRGGAQVRVSARGRGKPLPRRWQADAQVGLEPASVRATVRFARSPLAALNPFLVGEAEEVSELQGEASGEAWVEWHKQPQRLNYDLQVALEGLGLRLESVQHPLASFSGQVRLTPREATARGLRGQVGPHRLAVQRVWISLPDSSRWELQGVQARILPQQLAGALPKEVQLPLLEAHQPLLVRELLMMQGRDGLRIAGELSLPSLVVTPSASGDRLPAGLGDRLRVTGKVAFDLLRRSGTRALAAWQGWVATPSLRMETPTLGVPVECAGRLAGREGEWRASRLQVRLGEMPLTVTAEVALTPFLRWEGHIRSSRLIAAGIRRLPGWPRGWVIEGGGGFDLRGSGARQAVNLVGTIVLPHLRTPQVAVGKGRLNLALQGSARDLSSWRGYAELANVVLQPTALPQPVAISKARALLAGRRLAVSFLQGKAGGSPFTATGIIALRHEPSFDLALSSSGWRWQDLRAVLPEEMQAWRADPVQCSVRLTGTAKAWDLSGQAACRWFATPQADLREATGSFHLQPWPGGDPLPLRGTVRLERASVQVKLPLAEDGVQPPPLPAVSLRELLVQHSETGTGVSVTRLSTGESVLDRCRLRIEGWDKQRPARWSGSAEAVALAARDVAAFRALLSSLAEIEGEGRLVGRLQIRGTSQALAVNGPARVMGDWRWRGWQLAEAELELEATGERTASGWRSGGRAKIARMRGRIPDFAPDLQLQQGELRLEGDSLSLAAQGVQVGRSRFSRLQLSWQDWQSWPQGRVEGETEFALAPGEWREWLPEVQALQDLRAEGVWEGRAYVQGPLSRLQVKAEGQGAPLSYAEGRLQGGGWRLAGWVAVPQVEGEPFDTLVAGTVEHWRGSWAGSGAVEVVSARWLAGSDWVEWRDADVRLQRSRLHSEGRATWVEGRMAVEGKAWNVHLRPAELWACLPPTWRPGAWEVQGEGEWEGDLGFAGDGRKWWLQGDLSGGDAGVQSPWGRGRVERARLQGQVEVGELRVVSLRGQAVLRDLDPRPLLAEAWREPIQPVGEVELTFQVQGTPEAPYADVEATLRDATAGDLQFALLTLRAEARGDRARLQVVNAEGTAGSLRAEVWARWDGEEPIWYADAAWSCFPLPALASLPLQPATDPEQGSRPVFGERWRADGHADLWVQAEAHGPPGKWAQASHGQWRLSGEELAWEEEALGHLQANGRWQGDHVRLEQLWWASPSGDFIGRGKVEARERTLDVDWQAAEVRIEQWLPLLARWLPALQEKEKLWEGARAELAVQGKVVGSWDDPHFSGQAGLLDGEFQRFPFDVIWAEIHQLDRQGVVLSRLEASHANYHLKGALGLSGLEWEPFDGDLLLALQMVADAEPMAARWQLPEPVQGMVAGRVDIQGRLSQPWGEASLTWETPSYGKLDLDSLTARLQVEPDRLKLERTRFRRGDSQIEVEGEVRDWQERERTHLNLSWGQTSLRLEDAAPLLPAGLTGQGTLTVQAGTVTGTLADWQLQVAASASRLMVNGMELRDLAIRLRQSAHRTELQEFHLAAFEGELSGSGGITWGERRLHELRTANTRVQIKPLVDFLARLSQSGTAPWQQSLREALASLPNPLEGELQIQQAWAAGPLSSPEGEVVASIRQGRVGSRELPPIDAQLKLGQSWPITQVSEVRYDTPTGRVAIDGGVRLGEGIGLRVMARQLPLEWVNSWLPLRQWQKVVALGKGLAGTVDAHLWAVGDLRRPEIGMTLGAADLHLTEVPLFVLSPGLLEDLNQGRLSEALRRELKEHRVSLSGAATLRTLEAGGRWQLADEAETYVVVKQGKRLVLCGRMSLGEAYLEGEVVGDQARLSRFLWQHPGCEVRVEAVDLPLVAGTFRLDRSGEVRGGLQLHIKQASALTPLFPQVAVLEGRGSLAMQVAGLVEKPVLEGEGGLDFSAVQLRNWPLPLRQVSGRIALEPTATGLTRVALQDWTSRWGDGTMAARGRVELHTFDPNAVLANPVDLDLRWDNVAFSRSSSVDVKGFGGHLRIVPSEAGNHLMMPPPPLKGEAPESAALVLNGGRVLLEADVLFTQPDPSDWARNRWKVSLRIPSDQPVGMRVPLLARGEVVADLSLESTPRQAVPLELRGAVMLQNASLGLPLKLPSGEKKGLDLPGWPALEVELVTGRNVRIRSRIPEVEAPVNAGFTLTGTPAALRMKGDATIPRGRMRVSTLTGVYELERSQVVVSDLTYYPGEARLEPRVQVKVAARTRLTDPETQRPYRVSLAIEGSLQPGLETPIESRWSIIPVSEPPLPEQELLARLTRRQEVLTAFQQGRLGRFLEDELKQMAVYAVSQMALRDVEHLIREGLGLTRFRIDYELSQAVRLEAEARFLKKLYLTYTTVVGDGSSDRYELRLDYEVDDRVRIGYETDGRNDRQLNIKGVVQFR